jgi:hypothetical protein
MGRIVRAIVGVNFILSVLFMFARITSWLLRGSPMPDESWEEAVLPMAEMAGNSELTRYCPGCEVLLDSVFGRWEGSE